MTSPSGSKNKPIDNSITQDLISQISTISFRLDQKLKMSGLSETLNHHLPDANSAVITDIFDIVRPAGSSTYEQFKSTFGAMVLLTAKDQSFAIRGQFIVPHDAEADVEGGLVFVGSPWLSWITQNIDTSKIRMKDFAATDVQLDQLIFLSTEQQNLQDLKQLTEELKTARDEAEQFNVMQAKFFALMSHEMRTPLNGVATALELIDDKELQGESLKMLQIARSSSSNLKRVIDQVLNYSKLQAGGFANEPHSFDLQRTLTSVVDLHTPFANQQGNELIAEGFDEPELIKADEPKLRQVLINLVGNALKFTTDGKVSIRASFDKEAEQLLIKVIDTGEGIPEELQPKIFESYWTFDSSRREFKGTGLGLNICKQFIDIMDGEIGFESFPRQGTEFQIRLPVHGFVSEDAEAISQSDANSEGHGAEDLDRDDLVPNFSGRVLLVEDNKTNQYLSQLLLEKRGLNVHLADDGVEALAQVEANQYDLILMDISMPVMDGIEATEKLREEYSKEQLPIVAMTAHAGDEYHNRFNAVGMNSAMSKPIDLLILNETLARWCKPAKANRQTDRHKGNFEQSVVGSSQDNQDASPMGTEFFVINEAEKLRSELGSELFVQIADVFQAEATERLAEIMDAHGAQDSDNLAKRAHSIRSSAETLGCIPLADQLKRIELLARESDWSALGTEVDSLPNLMTNSLAMLKEHILGMA